MDQQALVAAVVGARSQLDFIWNFFVTVHIAVFALLFIYDHAIDALNPFGRVLSLAGIALFDWINASALINTYQLLDAFHDQYRVSFGAMEKLAPLYVERFVNASFVAYPTRVLFTHGLAFLVVSLALIWPNFISHPEKKRNKPRVLD